MRERLIGECTLVSYEAIDPDGRRSRPYGNAVGRLSYDHLGYMAGQVMRPERDPVTTSADGTRNLRAAYAGYIAYFGTYQLNAAENAVVHQVEGALNPEWVGGRQVRRIRFEGDLLILQADVSRQDGTAQHVLVWKKLTASSPPPRHERR